MPKIIFLCSECFSTTVLYNYIGKSFPIERVITEKPMRGAALAKKRAKKIGWFKVFGQILFSVIVVRILRISSKKRKVSIFEKYLFDETAIPSNKKLHFTSVNDEDCIAALTQLNPDIVIVNGTRIISKKVLESISAVFINMHAGITPKYRGVHGGYWAVAKNDIANCGVTVHLVDKGIDTGSILYQTVIPLSPKDNFYTYPFLQFGEGLPLMLKAVQDAAIEKIKPVKPTSTESFLWTHPTIWQYLYLRIFKGKK